MEPQTNTTPAGFLDRNRMLIKGFLIGFLIIIMLIPAAMLSNLVSERASRQTEVIQEVSSKWASGQTITGPVVVVPYVGHADSNKIYHSTFYLLPEQLNINGKVLPEIRHRSLYDVTLYRSALSLSGSFDPASIQKLGIAPQDIQWDQAEILLGLDDMRGLEDDVHLQWDANLSILEAGLPDNNLVKEGLRAKVVLDTQKKMTFNIEVKFKGSEYLYFTPLGKSTDVQITSPWKDPAFDGQYLPTQPAKITDSGFLAQWKILQASRSYPQAWKAATQYDISKSSFGVKLLQPTDSYAKTQRSVKYAILVIALTFTIFFFIEIFQKRQVHPIQYILVGIALCIFYTLLLSISEYTGFNNAYLIAAVATVSLIGFYVWSVFKKGKTAIGFTTALAGLYLYIFVLIQLQDYALLCGSIGLFVILAIIMYFSRKVDWYQPSAANIKQP